MSGHCQAGEVEHRWAEIDRTDQLISHAPGHALKTGNRELVLSYLRVGLDPNGEWRTYKLRQDFIACEKIQMEDDITASIVVPTADLPNTSPKYVSDSVKLAACISFFH